MARNVATVRGLKAVGAVPPLEQRTSGSPQYAAATLPMTAPR